MNSPAHILNKYLFPGSVLAGRYRLERMIGGGAYGVIYVAMDQINHERVALKVLPPPGEASSQIAQDRFQLEMKVIESLIHPNIVSIYDYGQTEQDIPFMVLEYIEGKTLEDEVKDAPMSLEEGTHVTLQIVSALAVAHEKGIIHRDLKPANVMIVQSSTGFPKVKVLDFGMAKVKNKLGGESMAALTREGIAVGTPRYIAPEQARGLEVGPWTDLYAVGLLMYEMFTCARAVKANSVEEAVFAHVSITPLHLPELYMVPQEMQPILQKLLEKDPRHRYQSAAEVIKPLEALELRWRQRHSGVAQRFSPAVHLSAAQAQEVPVAFGAACDADSMSTDPTHVHLSPIQASASTTSSVHAHVASKRVASKRSSEPSLDLNDENIEAFEKEQRDARALISPTSDGDAWAPVSRPNFMLGYMEVLLSPVLGIFAFMCFTAHFGAQSFSMRCVTGLVPLVLSLVLACVLVPSFSTRIHARFFNMAAVGIIILAHFWNARVMVSVLFREPAWFLQGFKDALMISLLYDILTLMGREYAVFLSAFLY